MTEAELLAELVRYADQSYKLHLVSYGFLTFALAWIAGHQR